MKNDNVNVKNLHQHQRTINNALLKVENSLQKVSLAHIEEKNVRKDTNWHKELSKSDSFHILLVSV